MSVSVTLNNVKLVRLIGQLGPNAATAVDETARSIQELSREIAPRRTGALSQSIYVSTPNESDYGQHASAASSLNPLAQIQQEVTPHNAQYITGPPPDTAYADIVGVAVQYGLFNELGTRYMAPHPFLFPSIEPNKNTFISSMSSIANV
jgi:HK97 gp10 family phage protein